MKPFDFALPIDAALPELIAALGQANTAVLVAPPGAGKTTRVPLALIDEPWTAGGKILVLEPRRIAARAAAERMAATLAEKVGDTVGYRVRFGSKVSRRTRVEIVTEGIFTRMVIDDPMLNGVAAVLFDEFHERSLDADLGLALARDAQQGLRDDLRLLVMSATIDGARIASHLGDATVIESQGRAFPVETRYVGRAQRIDEQIVDVTLKALRADAGSILVFLPGAGEIRRAETRLRERLADPAVDVVALYGALDAATQDRAISPSPPGRRKVVLATSIAETSLTIQGVRVVIDAGLARVPRYEPDVGVTRLETIRVARAAADQRRGRAGRTEPGICYRLWDEGQTAALTPYAPPEILSADLSTLVLDLAQWGVAEPGQLAFLDPPPKPALTEAKALLRDLDAIDADGRITEAGRRLRSLPLPPRLARMVVDADGAHLLAAELAVLIVERGLGGDSADITHRLDNLRRDRSRRAEDARAMAKRWEQTAGPRERSSLSPHGRSTPSPLVGEGWGGGLESSRRDSASVTSTPTPRPSPQGGGENKQEHSVGGLIALAYPDRVAKNRGGGSGAFLLANGRGANVDAASPLAREPYLAVAELIGSAAQSRIVLAAPITQSEIENLFASHIAAKQEISFDAASLSLRGRRAKKLGAIALSDVPVAVTPGEAAARIFAAGLIKAGLGKLPWSKHLQQWRDRVLFLRRAEGEDWPDLSDAGLAESADDWLAPLLADKTALSQLGADAVGNALQGLLPYPMRRRLDTEAPTHFTAPTGSQVPIDYEAEAGPTASIRVQELFGLAQHPSIAGGRVPLVIELLSPGHRPVQVTRDLPGFWRGSYATVRTEMRGRYPRHPWPDDPMSAPPTRRAKPRGT